MSAQSSQRWTPAEYLAFERGHPEKHELIDGRIVLQVGEKISMKRLRFRLKIIQRTR